MCFPPLYILLIDQVSNTLTKKGLALQMTGTSMNEVHHAAHQQNMFLDQHPLLFLERSDP